MIGPLVPLPAPAVPSPAQICTWPLPHLSGRRMVRGVLRALCTVARTRVLSIDGFERILPDRDPFILTLNHTQRLESVLIPALLMLLRGGKAIHFLSDWNFRLIPIVGQLFAAGDTIVVTRKPARPRILNLLKPFFREATSSFDRARRRLERGGAIGIFPEGTVNPNPRQLLRGRSGAAWLALSTGVPVIPAGIRFPHASLMQPISEFEPLSLRIGDPISVPPLGREPRLDEVRACHAEIMRRIAVLCEKAWYATNRRDVR